MFNASKPWQVLSKRTLDGSPWLNLAQWAVRLPDGSIIPDHLDVNETLALRWFTRAEGRDLIVRNEIRDGLSLTILCWAFTAYPDLCGLPED